VTAGPSRLTCVAAALALAGSARAQGTGRTDAVDAYSGPVVSESRIVGLAGAYVAVAEGIGGALSNPAAVAHRRRDLDRTWDLGGTLTWYVPRVTQLGRIDVGNDGRGDGDLAEVGNVQLGAMLQVGRLGLGVIGSGWVLGARQPGGEVLEVGTSDVSLVAGWAAPRDALVLGAALTFASGELTWVPPGTPAGARGGPRVEYAGARLRLGVLLRPRHEPWRIGLAFDPGATARRRDGQAEFPTPTPSSFAFPWQLSFGVARWLGPNAKRLNAPAAVDVWANPEGRESAWEPGARPVLVSLQADYTGPTAGAATLDSALRADRPPQPSGGRAALAVRAGAEWEAWARVLRARVGSYLEPSRTGGDPRLHGTFGLDVRVPFWPWDLQLVAAGDVARLFRNVTVSLGLWSETGPLPDAPW
jgi:hypothetical protein